MSNNKGDTKMKARGWNIVIITASENILFGRGVSDKALERRLDVARSLYRTVREERDEDAKIITIFC
jgi:hypothetical protein